MLKYNLVNGDNIKLVYTQGVCVCVDSIIKLVS